MHTGSIQAKFRCSSDFPLIHRFWGNSSTNLINLMSFRKMSVVLKIVFFNIFHKFVQHDQVHANTHPGHHCCGRGQHYIGIRLGLRDFGWNSMNFRLVSCHLGTQITK